MKATSKFSSKSRQSNYQDADNNPELNSQLLYHPETEPSFSTRSRGASVRRLCIASPCHNHGDTLGQGNK